MIPLLVGLAVGVTIGAVATILLVVDPLRRERELFRRRVMQEQMRTFGAQARLDAWQNARRGDDAWPRKVADLRSV